MGKYNVNQQLYALGKYMSAYEAVQEGLGKRVEIRILAQRAQEGSIELSRFSAEINNLKNLDHPSILRVLDCGVANGKLYYVVELKQRTTIADWLSTNPPVEERLKVAVQLAAGLKYMHGKGIIHRGLDDAAVNYDTEVQQAYISQFTFVKNVRTDNLTARGIGNVFQLLTTPEGAMGQALDARSDVFLLGVLLFKMLTGQECYSAKAFLGLTNETAGNVQQKKLRDCDPAANEALDKCIAKATAVIPTDRYQTMQELHDGLLDAGKKMKLPKWADRDKASQPVGTTTQTDEGGNPSGANNAAAKVSGANKPDPRASRVQSKVPRKMGPPSGKNPVQEGDAPATDAAAPAATGNKLQDLIAQLKADPKKQKIAIAAGVAALLVLLAAAFALMT